MTEDDRSQVYRKRINCTCEWEVKFGYGVAFTLAVFEAKRLLVLVLEIFAEWQVIRFAGGFQPIALTLADVSLGLPCALITVRTIRRRKLSSFCLKAKQALRCLSIIIIVCIAMNVATLVSIGYHISMSQEALVNVFNASMLLYVNALSYKYAIDEIQFTLQCCGHTSYTDWFLFDWQKVDYASRVEVAKQDRISDEDYRDFGVPFSCCSLRALTPCMHTDMTDDKTINVNGCAEVISPILFRIVIIAYIMTITLIIMQVLLSFLITRMACRFIPFQTSFPRIKYSTAPFTITTASPRTHVPQASAVNNFILHKKTDKLYSQLSTHAGCFKIRRKVRAPKARYSCPIVMLNDEKGNTWDVAKIKPSLHEEHRISVRHLRNKCTR